MTDLKLCLLAPEFLPNWRRNLLYRIGESAGKQSRASSSNRRTNTKS